MPGWEGGAAGGALGGPVGWAVGSIIGTGISTVLGGGGHGFANSKYLRKFFGQAKGVFDRQAGTVTQLPGARPPPSSPSSGPDSILSGSARGVLPWLVIPYVIGQGIDIYAAAQDRARREAERQEREQEKRERDAERAADKEAEQRRETQREAERQSDRAWQATQRQWEVEAHQREERNRIERESRQAEEEAAKRRKIDEAPLERVMIDPFLGPLPDPFPGIPAQVLKNVITAPPAPKPPASWSSTAIKWGLDHPGLLLLGVGALSKLGGSSKKRARANAEPFGYTGTDQGLTYDQAPAVSLWPQTETAPATKCKPCRCKKPKKRGPRKARSVCYKGSYVETATGLRKRKRERIPC